MLPAMGTKGYEPISPGTMGARENQINLLILASTFFPFHDCKRNNGKRARHRHPGTHIIRSMVLLYKANAAFCTYSMGPHGCRVGRPKSSRFIMV